VKHKDQNNSESLQFLEEGERVRSPEKKSPTNRFLLSARQPRVKVCREFRLQTRGTMGHRQPSRNDANRGGRVPARPPSANPSPQVETACRNTEDCRFRFARQRWPSGPLKAPGPPRFVALLVSRKLPGPSGRGVRKPVQVRRAKTGRFSASI